MNESAKEVMDVQSETVEKVVLVVFNSRRRPVKFFSTNRSEDSKNLMDAVLEAFKDVLESDEGSALQSNSWYLQPESKEWGGLVDVCDGIENHCTVYLQPKEKVTIFTVLL